MKRFVAFIVLLLASAVAAAQTPGSFVANQTLTAAQLNSTFATKQDNGGPLALTGPIPTNVVGNSPLNGTYLAGGNNVILCPGANAFIGCIAGLQSTASVYAVQTTSGPPNQQNNTALFNMVSNSGYAPIWSQSTAYNSTTYMINAGNMYTETVSACTSAATGTGPSGTGSGIADGTCIWNYLTQSYANGNQALGFLTQVYANSAHAWGMSGGAQVNSGWTGGGVFGAEIDINGNFSSIDPTNGSANTIDDIYLGPLIGTNPISNLIYLAPSRQSYSGTWGAHDAIYATGVNSFKDNVFEDNSTGASNSIYVHGSYVNNGYADASTAPVGVDIAGTHSTAALFIGTASGTTGVGMLAGVRVCLNGSVDCLVWNGSSMEHTAQAQFDGPVYVQSGNPVSLFNATGVQQFGISVGAGSNGAFTLYDGTNAKAPFTVQGNSPTGALNITTAFVASNEPITPGVYTVATLPSAAASGVGARAFVTDATACTFAAAPTGGGAVKCPVFSTGAVWQEG